MRSIAAVALASTLAACSSRQVGESLIPGTNAVDFGFVAVGTSEHRSLDVTLEAAAPALLSVDPGSLPPGVTVDAGSGPLVPGESRRIAVIFAPASAGTLSGTLVLRAGGAAALVAVAGASQIPRLLVDPPALDFGQVPRGQNFAAPVVLTNPTSVTESIVASTDDPAFLASRTVLELTPGSTASLGVVFTPMARLAVHSVLHLRSCVGCDDVASVALSGQGAVEAFGLSPSPLEFGPHVVGTTGCLSVAVSNTGDLPIHFKPTKPDAAFNPGGVFQLWDLDPDLVLEAGLQTGVTVCFTPQATARSYTGKLVFTTMSGGIEVLTVQGSGGEM